MEYNLICYNREGFPTMRYALTIDTFYFYKYSMNYKIRETIALSSFKETIEVSYRSEEGNENINWFSWGSQKNKEITFGDKNITYKLENKIDNLTKTLKVTMRPKESFVGVEKISNGDSLIGKENHNGKFNYIFGITKDKIDSFKEILENDTRKKRNRIKS